MIVIKLLLRIKSANPAAFLEMNHVINDALNTVNLGLKIDPN